MSLLNNFSRTTGKTVQKVRDMTDIARLNSMISEEEIKINNIYYQVGKLYVAMHTHDCEEEFRGMVSSVAQAEERISSYRQQIQDIKGLVRCPQCGAEVQSHATYCSSCGFAMPVKDQHVNMDDVVRCENCGAMVKKGFRFCTSCGKPMVSVSEPEHSEVPEAGAEKRVCFNCGSIIEEDVAFCTECGIKL